MTITASVGNWVGELSTTVGNDEKLVLGGALPGFTTFESIGEEEFWYAIIDGNNREAGWGTYSNNILTRTKITSVLLDGFYIVEPDVGLTLSGFSEVYSTFNKVAFDQFVDHMLDLDIHFSDAPADSVLYGRFNNTWVDVELPGRIEVPQFKHDLRFGEAIRWNGTKFTPALANSEYTLAIGVVVAVIDANNFVYATLGTYTVVNHGFSVLQWHYLDDVKPGALVTTEPDDISHAIVYARTKDEFTIYQYRPIIREDGDNPGGFVEEAPIDGTPYSRQDADWVPGSGGPPGPEGPAGTPGAAATIAVGSTDTISPGNPATVLNVGTSTAAIFEFDIPQGEQGAAGAPGADGADGADGVQGEDGLTGGQGIQGIPGPTGDDGPVGPAGADSTVPGPEGPDGPEGPQGPAGEGITLQGDSTVAEMNARDPALLTEGFAWLMTDAGNITSGIIQPVAVIIGDLVAATASGSWSNLGAVEGPEGPEGDPGTPGDPGDPGVDGTDGVAATADAGITTTLGPGVPATVVNTGGLTAAVFDFGIPEGVQGDAGVQGDPGADGADSVVPGPEGPTAVSTDANNSAVLGTDSLVFVPVPAEIPLSIDDLEDVNAPTPSEGNVLVWNTTALAYVNQPNAGGGVVEFDYKWDAVLDALPSAGDIHFNNADYTLVTEVYINIIDRFGADRTLFLEGLFTEDWLNIYPEDDTSTHASFDVAGPAVLNGDVFTIPVINFEDTALAFVNNANLRVFWRRAIVGNAVPEAPIDGVPYSRQDAAWIASPTGTVGEAPVDGTPYERQDSAWIPALPGLQGPQGDPGADGADSTVPGPTGPEGPASVVPGPDGPQGDPGATGPAGPSAVSTTLPNFAKLGGDSLIQVPIEVVAALPGTPVAGVIYFVTG